MSKSRHEIYVINFINSLWVPCDVTMGLFELTNMFGVVMATQVKDLLSLYNLLNKLITYVKDENSNLSTLAQSLTLVFSCGPLEFTTP
jgi:hypothetical protein